jgi:hypothetical protein
MKCICCDKTFGDYALKTGCLIPITSKLNLFPGIVYCCLKCNREILEDWVYKKREIADLKVS